MPTVLITGVNGFVGSATARYFQQLGWTVHGTARQPSPSDTTPCDNYCQQDLAFEFSPQLKQAIYQSDAIVHTAARSSPWGTTQQFHQSNVQATENLLASCQAAGSPPFVHLSSASVYYLPHDQLNITEDAPLAQPAINLYAASKQQAEQRVSQYSGRQVILRPRAIYGVGDTVLFPRILKAASAGRFPLIERQDPVVGDFVAIDNLVHCIFQSAIRPDIYGPCNVTDGQPRPLIPFLMSVFHQLDIPQPRRKWTVQRAERIARWLERIYRWLPGRPEPPLTRFGVMAFACSKTFDISRMNDWFAPLPVSTDEAVQQFVQWVKDTSPYSG